jgi:hypothetical protein
MLPISGEPEIGVHVLRFGLIAVTVNLSVSRFLMSRQQRAFAIAGTGLA